jgi:hypothetical protein
LLPDENVEDFEGLRASLIGALGPVGELEMLLTDRVVACAWRLRRLGRVETGLYVHRFHTDIAREAQQDADACVADPVEDLMDCLETVRDREKLEAAVARGREADRASRELPLARLGGLFAHEAAESDSFSKLSRYEAGIERALYRALHELQRVQAARTGDSAGLPVALDVDVNVSAVPPAKADPTH